MNTDTTLKISRFMNRQLDALRWLAELADYYKDNKLPDTVSAADLQQMKNSFSEMQQVCLTVSRLAAYAEKKLAETKTKKHKKPVPAALADDDDSLDFLDE